LSNGTAENVAKAARVIHNAANQLEKVHADAKSDTSIDCAYLDETVGMIAGATVLEALALELVLKARLIRAGTRPPKWHSHSDLFALLPAAEQLDAEQIYQANRHPTMRATLAEVLDHTAKAFERWRYHHEQPAEPSLGEMQRAFGSLAAPL
jgi:HEPN domain-containing protein